MTTLTSFQVTDNVIDVLAAQYNLLLGSIFQAQISNATTMSGTVTLADTDTAIQRFNCNGANRIVKLPAYATTNHPFFIVNTTAATYTLDVQTNAGVSLLTTLLAANGGNALVVPDGSSSYGLIGGASGAGDMVLASIQTVTGAKTFNDAKLILAGSSSGTTTLKSGAAAGTSVITLPVATDTLIGQATTDTLTNKRVTKRTGTTTSSATPTINTDNVDFYSLTAQAADITSFTTNLSGTPTEAQTLWIAITGTAARAITWGTSFEASTVALPTTTVTTARLDVGFVWNSVTSKWRVVAVA